MFEPGDPRYGEILDLATSRRATSCSTGNGALAGARRRAAGQRPQQGSAAERRQDLRGPAELEVDILAPDEMASLATSTVSAGGISMRIAEVIPIGTPIDLSIKVKERKIPLLVTAQVVWSRPGELGAAFVDLFQNDRELLEGLAVKALLEGR